MELTDSKFKFSYPITMYICSWESWH